MVLKPDTGNKRVFPGLSVDEGNVFLSSIIIDIKLTHVIINLLFDLLNVRQVKQLRFLQILTKEMKKFPSFIEISSKVSTFDPWHSSEWLVSTKHSLASIIPLLWYLLHITSYSRRIFIKLWSSIQLIKRSILFTSDLDITFDLQPTRV